MTLRALQGLIVAAVLLLIGLAALLDGFSR